MPVFCGKISILSVDCFDNVSTAIALINYILARAAPSARARFVDFCLFLNFFVSFVPPEAKNEKIFADKPPINAY